MSRSVASLLVSVTVIWMAGCGGGSCGGLSILHPILSRVERERALAESQGQTQGRAPGSGDFWLSSGRGPGGKRSVGPAQDGPALWLANRQPEEDSGPPERVESTETTRQTRRRSGPLLGFWVTLKRDLKEMPAELWTDTKAVYTSPTNLAVLGVTYGGSLAIQQTGPDDTVEDSFKGGHRTFKDDWRDGFAAAGNPGTHFALAGLWYLVGQQSQDEKTYQVGKTLFSALIINDLSTLAGKAATWEDGPDGEWGSFPSGHTSSSFAFASVMHEAYGHWVGAPLYALSALVAYERLDSNEHYLSDVVMGGVMGLVIGHTVAGEHGFEVFGGEIVPYVDPYGQTSGLAWVKHFK